MELQKIWVALAMKADEYTKGIDQATKQADGFAKNLTGKLGGAFESLKGIATGAMLGVAGAIAGGVVAIGVAAFDVSQQTNNAVLDMQAQFGQTAEEAERTAQLSRQVWADNWGESVTDVSGAMGLVIQQLGELGVTSDEQVMAATADAIALRDAFGLEVPESIDATRALMERFRITSDEAFDLITSGMQSGLNANGDFLDSIREYAPVFESAGFTAGEMYRIMESGAASGVLGTDKISDAIKEMNIKLNEGSDETKAAFDAIGLSYDEIAAQVAAGETTWAEQFNRIVGSINSVEDPLQRQQVQVGIFGTMAEDLGHKFTEGLTTAGSAMTAFEGATDSISAKYTSLGSLWEGMKRQGIEAVAPLTDGLLALANEHMPVIQEAIGGFTEKLGEIVGLIVEGDLQGAMAAVFGSETATTIINIANGAKDLADRIVAIATPIVENLAQFVSFKDILAALGVVLLATVIPAVVSLAVSLAPILLVVGAVIGIIALLRNAWENDWGGIQEKTRAVIDFVNDKIEKLRQWWAEHGEAILAKAEEVWSAIKSAVETAINIITSVVDAFRSAFEGDWRGFGEKLRQAWDQVWSLITDAVEKFKNWFTDIDWAQLGKDILTGLGNGIESLQTWVAEKMAAVAAALLDAIKGFFGIQSPSTVMLTAGKDIIQGLIDGILEIGNNLWEETKSVFSGFWDSLKGFFGIESPAELTKDAGANVGQGFIEGVQGLGDTLWPEARDPFDQFLDDLTLWWQEIEWTELPAFMIERLRERWQEWWSDTEPEFEDFWDSLQRWWIDQKWIELAEHAIEEIRRGFSNFWSGWRPAFQAMYITIRQDWNSNDWASLGAAIIDGIIAGVNANEGRLRARMREIAIAARQEAEAELEISSPSMVFFRIGVAIADGLIAGIESRAAAIEDTVQQQMQTLGELFQSASSIGNLAGGILAGEFARRHIRPLEERLERLDEAVEGHFAAVEERVAKTMDWEGLSLSSLPYLEAVEMLLGIRRIMLDTGDYVGARQAQAALDALQERNKLQNQYEQALERQLELQEKMADLAFLQQQMELIKLITDNNLGLDLLDGLRLGLSADPGALADTLLVALQRMIAAAQQELQIHSPSRWGVEFGQNVIAGIAKGLERSRAIEQSLTRSLQRGFAPAASYGVALAPAGGGRTDIRINGGYNVYVSGLMDDPLEAIEVQRR